MAPSKAKRRPPGDADDRKTRAAASGGDGDATDEATKAARGAARRRRVAKAKDTAATVAHVLKNRDRIVADGLHLLATSGWLDDSARVRLWQLYQQGDTRTRMALQDLVARTFRVPLERLEQLDGLEDEDIDLSRVSEEDLERLRGIDIPSFDPAVISERIRSLDVERFLRDDDEDEMGGISRLISEIPVKAHKLRRSLFMMGAILLVLVGAAVAFPDQARIILFYGLMALTAVLGGLLIKWGVDVGRAFRRYDLELGVLVKLRPAERRLIILRRLWLRLIDTNRLADALERIFRSVVPEPFVDGRALDDDGVDDVPADGSRGGRITSPAKRAASRDERPKPDASKPPVKARVRRTPPDGDGRDA